MSSYQESNNSSGDPKSVPKKQPAQSSLVVGANIRNNNERFMYLYKEAIKQFRIPQYGYEDRIANNE